MARCGPKPVDGPTAAQRRLLSAVRALADERAGVPPTIQELADRLGIKGASVHEQVRKLREKGLLHYEPNRARTIRIVEPSPDARRAVVDGAGPADVCRVRAVYAASGSAAAPLPLFASRIAAGFPSPADDHIDAQLDLHRHLVKHPAATFFVRVEGHSMVEAGIRHGSILVVDRSLEPRHGQIVVAVVQGELTVKRLEKRRDGRVFLVPENHTMAPLEITEEMEMAVWGVVTSAIQEF